MNKKSIGALLLSAALFVGATGATFAYFTDTTNSDTQTITLGNVHVAFTPRSGDDTWQVIDRAVPNILEAQRIDPRSAHDIKEDDGYDEIVTTKNKIVNVAPGDLLLKSFTLKNTGSLDAKVSLKLADAKVTAKDGTVIDSTTTPSFANNLLFKAYSLNSDGTLGDEIALGVDAQLPGQFVLDAKQHETIAVYSFVYLGTSIKNDAMDTSVTFNVQADATQWNNPGWNQ